MATKPIFDEDEGIYGQERSAILDDLGTFEEDKPLVSDSFELRKVAEPIDLTPEPIPSLEGVGRTPESTIASELKENRLARQKAQQKQGVATSGLRGLQIGEAQTGETEFASATTLVQVLAGAGMGAATGGPIGAVAGGVAAGLGAFLSTNAEKKRKKEQRAKEARYQKMVKEQLAREERWRKEERMMQLEQLGYDRKTAKLENMGRAYQEINDKMIKAVNNNNALKERFARSGF